MCEFEYVESFFCVVFIHAARHAVYASDLGRTQIKEENKPKEPKFFSCRVYSDRERWVSCRSTPLKRPKPFMRGMPASLFVFPAWQKKIVAGPVGLHSGN